MLIGEDRRNYICVKSWGIEKEYFLQDVQILEVYTASCFKIGGHSVHCSEISIEMGHS